MPSTGLASGRAFRLLLVLVVVLLVPDVEEDVVLLRGRVLLLVLLVFVIALAGGIVKYTESFGAEEGLVGVGTVAVEELKVPIVMLGVTPDVEDVVGVWAVAPRRFSCKGACGQIKFL